MKKLSALLVSTIMLVLGALAGPAVAGGTAVESPCGTRGCPIPPDECVAYVQPWQDYARALEVDRDRFYDKLMIAQSNLGSALADLRYEAAVTASLRTDLKAAQNANTTLRTESTSLRAQLDAEVARTQKAYRIAERRRTKLDSKRALIAELRAELADARD